MYHQCATAQKQGVGEMPGKFWVKKESAISLWWFHQAERVDHLHTTDGERVIVLSRGALNDGPGPDVRNVHLLIDDLEQSGDVEFHQRSSDWYRHGHHLDAAYGHVILHVVGLCDSGPDLPCLVVKSNVSGQPVCIATRPASQGEIILMAQKRLDDKINHMELLALSQRRPFSALGLGLLEVLCAGPHRSRDLHQLALRLGWEGWPDARDWAGSSQRYHSSRSRQVAIENILENPPALESTIQELQSKSLSIQKIMSMNPFISLGVSRFQYLEWVINCLVPMAYKSLGLAMWNKIKPFRNYGFEKKLISRLGLDKPGTIAEQQALILWNRMLCKPQHCRFCPLVLS